MTKKSKKFDWNRRRVLQGLGTAGVLGLAGCTGGDGDSEDGSSDGSSGTSSDGSSGTGSDGATEGASAGMSGGKLRLAQVKSPIEFDPIVLNDVPSDEVAILIFEGLYGYDEGTGVVPVLATGEPEVSDDGTTWTVPMTSEATFSNGDPVTPEDVAYSFRAPVEEETENAAELNMVDTIETGDAEVTFNLKYPFGAFLNNLTWPVVPKAVREDDREAFNTQQPIGSGPFVFEEWQEGNFVRLSRNDEYWGEPMANLSEVELVPVEEATTRVTTLKNGENDVVKEIPPKQYPVVENIGDASIQEVPGVGYFYLAFNCKEGPTADPTVREAIDYVFNMDQAVSSYVEPTGIRQYSPFPASLLENWDLPIDEWKGIPHDKDIERANALFEEAGVSKDYQWKIIVPPDDKREQIGISVSNGLKEAGFGNVSVQRLDWGAFLDKYNTGSADDYNMYTLGWSGSPDPDAFTYYLFGRTEDTLGVTNGTYYGENSEAGKQAAQKIVSARESADKSERTRLYSEAVTTILEERAHLPSYNLKNSFGVKEYVNDFIPHPVDQFHLSTDHNNVSVNK